MVKLDVLVLWFRVLVTLVSSARSRLVKNGFMHLVACCGVLTTEVGLVVLERSGAS